MRSDISDALRRLVTERADHLCEYCLVHEADVYHGCEVDHVISVKHGGITAPENLAYACFHCNRRKGTDLGSLNLRTGTLVRFFDPRSDAWARHFCLNEARIDPLTEIGDVTSRMLEFNHPERLAFRRLLMEVGRYLTVEALARTKE